MNLKKKYATRHLTAEAQRALRKHRESIRRPSSSSSLRSLRDLRVSMVNDAQMFCERTFGHLHSYGAVQSRALRPYDVKLIAIQADALDGVLFH